MYFFSYMWSEINFRKIFTAQLEWELVLPGAELDPRWRVFLFWGISSARCQAGPKLVRTFGFRSTQIMILVNYEPLKMMSARKTKLILCWISNIVWKVDTPNTATRLSLRQGTYYRPLWSHLFRGHAKTDFWFTFRMPLSMNFEMGNWFEYEMRANLKIHYDTPSRSSTVTIHKKWF